MNENLHTKAKVSFFLQPGLTDSGRLCMSITRDEKDDIQVRVDPAQMTMLKGLYALSPDNFSCLMNDLIDAAFQVGISHGTEEAEEHRSTLEFLTLNYVP